MKTYNIFISHSWAYDDDYERLVNLLNARRYFSFRNFSVPWDNPIHSARNEPNLYGAIYSRMRPASVVLIMAGVYATHSKWINHEIDIAKHGFRSAKPIVAIRPRAQVNMSSAVRRNADALANWDTESIVAAIRRVT